MTLCNSKLRDYCKLSCALPRAHQGECAPFPHGVDVCRRIQFDLASLGRMVRLMVGAYTYAELHSCQNHEDLLEDLRVETEDFLCWARKVASRAWGTQGEEFISELVGTIRDDFELIEQARIDISRGAVSAGN